MKESGVMIKRMAREPMLIPMEPTTRESGMTISKRALVLSHGQMVPNMKAFTKTGKSMDREN